MPSVIHFSFPPGSGLQDTLSRDLQKEQNDNCICGHCLMCFMSMLETAAGLVFSMCTQLRAYGPKPEPYPEIANECLCAISYAKTEIHALFTHKTAQLLQETTLHPSLIGNSTCCILDLIPNIRDFKYAVQLCTMLSSVERHK